MLIERKKELLRCNFLHKEFITTPLEKRKQIKIPRRQDIFFYYFTSVFRRISKLFVSVVEENLFEQSLAPIETTSIT